MDFNLEDRGNSIIRKSVNLYQTTCSSNLPPFPPESRHISTTPPCTTPPCTTPPCITSQSTIVFISGSVSTFREAILSVFSPNRTFLRFSASPRHVTPCTVLFCVSLFHENRSFPVAYIQYRSTRHLQPDNRLHFSADLLTERNVQVFTPSSHDKERKSEGRRKRMTSHNANFKLCRNLYETFCIFSFAASCTKTESNIKEK